MSNVYRDLPQQAMCIKTVLLQKLRLGYQCELTDALMRHASIETDYDILTRNILIGLRSWVASTKDEVKESVQRPADWWEALKDRFLPLWAKQRWNWVRMEEITVIVNKYTLYPRVEMDSEYSTMYESSLLGLQ